MVGVSANQHDVCVLVMQGVAVAGYRFSTPTSTLGRGRHGYHSNA